MAWHTDRIWSCVPVACLTQFELTGNAMRFANDRVTGTTEPAESDGSTANQAGVKNHLVYRDFLELKDAWYKAQSDEEYVEYGQSL